MIIDPIKFIFYRFGQVKVAGSVMALVFIIIINQKGKNSAASSSNPFFSLNHVAWLGIMAFYCKNLSPDFDFFLKVFLIIITIIAHNTISISITKEETSDLIVIGVAKSSKCRHYQEWLHCTPWWWWFFIFVAINFNPFPITSTWLGQDDEEENMLHVLCC